MVNFDKNDTNQKVVNLLSEKLKVNADSITRSSKLQDLGADSLDIVELIMRFEELFNIEIKDEDAEKLTNVGEVVDYIHEQRVRQN